MLEQLLQCFTPFTSAGVLEVLRGHRVHKFKCWEFLTDQITDETSWINILFTAVIYYL